MNTITVIILFLAGFFAFSTFGVAYLDYRKIYEEYREKIETNLGFYNSFCSDENNLIKHPQLLTECHKSKHAAFDDPNAAALRDVLMRWSLCDEKGCDGFIEKFMRYFSLSALLAAVVAGAFGTAILYQIQSRKFSEKLPL